MSDIEKAIFKAKLELETITPEEIQRWAIETLEKNPSNDLALEICFLSTPEQVVSYFKQLSQTEIYTYLTETTIKHLLVDYMLKKLNLVKVQNDLFPFLQKILIFSKFLSISNLAEMLNFYDLNLYSSLEGYAPSEPEVVFQELLADLETFCSETSNQESSNNF
ncbi:MULTISPECIES: hypothetical protein [Acinetobacter]|uniref:Uncharacterized protein n=2 Tax=Acinetobacter TaxID=469 RepID=A0A5P1URZ5_9GAMM|nr:MULTISPECIES: hypothetical protein [Acinetobacter]QBQ15201.1 hypothetical protein AHTJR_02390 [Acinetobacter haemolyticus]QER38590.1 hypothetical protein F2A31_02280 [Acinetobacter sp. C16S1]